MARYIDADAFLKKIERFSLSNGTTLGKHSGVADEIIDILIAEPIADVVPKSEVDRLETEIRLLTENSISAKYPCCVSCSKGLILTKSLEEYDKLLADIASEVAREIFEEIEKVFTVKYPMCTNPVLVLDSLSYAELKKKYTKESEGNDTLNNTKN